MSQVVEAHAGHMLPFGNTRALEQLTQHTQYFKSLHQVTLVRIPFFL